MAIAVQTKDRTIQICIPIATLSIAICFAFAGYFSQDSYLPIAVMVLNSQTCLSSSSSLLTKWIYICSGLRFFSITAVIILWASAVLLLQHLSRSPFLFLKNSVPMKIFIVSAKRDSFSFETSRGGYWVDL